MQNPNEPTDSQPDPAMTVVRPIVQPFIQAVSIACISVVPVAICFDTLIWALSGLFGLPRAVWVSADALATLLVLIVAVPALIGIYRHEQDDMIEERRFQLDRRD